MKQGLMKTLLVNRPVKGRVLVFGDAVLCNLRG